MRGGGLAVGFAWLSAMSESGAWVAWMGCIVFAECWTMSCATGPMSHAIRGLMACFSWVSRPLGFTVALSARRQSRERRTASSSRARRRPSARASGRVCGVGPSRHRESRVLRARNGWRSGRHRRFDLDRRNLAMKNLGWPDALASARGICVVQSKRRLAYHRFK